MFIRLLEKLIALYKRDKNYKIKTDYSVRQLLYILLYRAAQAFRGLYYKILIKSHGVIFVGRRVIIEHGYQVSSGKSLIIEDGVHLNALSLKGITFGNNVTIAKYAVMVCTGVVANKGVGITIGDNSAIGAQSFLGGQGGIIIGNNVIMGPQVKIFSENHSYLDKDTLIRKQPETRNEVIIKDNCWIGAGVTILAGVIIGEGCIVAAGAVITKSIPDNSLVAGIPGKILKNRLEK